MTVAVIACDISYYQPVVDDSYPRRWLIFRCCDGDFADPHWDQNARWAAAAVRSGRMLGWSAYVVYRPGKVQAILNHAATLPALGHIVIDVETWRNPQTGRPAISGDHSAEINQLADGLRRFRAGELIAGLPRVWVYGNQGDLASIFPSRGGIPVIDAKYGGGRPTVPYMLGWQYTDGQYTVPGLPTSTAPFGRCDHNVLYLPDAAAPDTTSSSSATPIPLSLEDDMILVRNAADMNQVGLLTDKGIAILQSGDTVHALIAAGVKVAAKPVAASDFASLVKWGRL